MLSHHKIQLFLTSFVAAKNMPKNHLFISYSCCHKLAPLLSKSILKSVFDSMVAVTFQIAFRAEIYANDVFSFLKNHF